MIFITVLVSEYYNQPKFYRFMPRSIFDILEAAEQNASDNRYLITADIPKGDFFQMLHDYNHSLISLHDGTKKG